MPQTRGRVDEVIVGSLGAAYGSTSKVVIRPSTGNNETFVLWGAKTPLTDIHKMWVSQLLSAVASNSDVTIEHDATSSLVKTISLHRT
jgi:hypothetical protein